MSIQPGTLVNGTDGTIGTIDALVINPLTSAITHVVVSIDDVPGSERLAPIELFDNDANRIDLDRHHFAQLPAFQTPDYLEPETSLRVGQHDVAPHQYWFHPFARARGTYTFALHDAVPVGEIEIRRHSSVLDRNGERIGSVHAFVVDPDQQVVTHIVVHGTHHLLPSELTVPLTAIERSDGDTVRLQLTGAAVRDLPAIPTDAGAAAGTAPR